MGWDFILKLGFLIAFASATAIFLIWYFIFRFVDGAKERLTKNAEAAQQREAELNQKIKEADAELQRRTKELDLMEKKMRQEVEEQSAKQKEEIIGKARSEAEEIITKAQNAREQVRQFNWLKVIGDAPGKGAILSFEAEGMHAHDLATILDREGVAVRAGHHCAHTRRRAPLP